MERNVCSKQVTALTDPTHYLTAQQRLYIDSIIAGKSPPVSARIAGYAHPEVQGYAILKSPKIKDAIQYLYKKHEKVADVSRKKVMDGMLEAIEFAKMQADPGNMISGWREIAKMCGYYAPEVKKIDVNITTKRVIDKLETLSDEDLLEMVETNARILEGEATEVLDALQEANS